MSALLKVLRRGARDNGFPALAFQDYVNYFTYGGLAYQYMPGTTLQQDRETPPSDFGGYVQQLYKTSPIVFATIATRHRVFSQARYQFQRMTNGKEGDLFGSPLLAPLEHPWGPSSTTSDLNGRMLLDADLAGNAFVARLPNVDIDPDGNVVPSTGEPRLSHMRPDWVIIVCGSKMSADRNPNWQLDAEVIGYLYCPGGPNSGEEPIVLEPQNVAHFAPHPDPIARWRGMSWLTPTIRDVMSDTAATQHKLMFFEQGATPNIVVSLNENVTPENFDKFVEIFEDQNEGVANAYKTLFFGGGASIDVVGANMRQMDFKQVQGAVETRIAAAGGVPSIVAGFSEGMQFTSYQDYGQARRAFADGTLAHLWQNAAGSLETLVDITRLPRRGSNARLWYDARHIAFLKADVKDDADVQKVKAETLNVLLMAGFKPDAALAAVEAGDFGFLNGQHSGMISVQLFKPGEKSEPSANGKGEVPAQLPPPAKPKT